MVGEGVDVRELPKLPLLINPAADDPLGRPDADDPPFNATIKSVNSCLQKNKPLYDTLVSQIEYRVLRIKYRVLRIEYQVSILDSILNTIEYRVSSVNLHYFAWYCIIHNNK